MKSLSGKRVAYIRPMTRSIERIERILQRRPTGSFQLGNTWNVKHLKQST